MEEEGDERVMRAKEKREYDLTEALMAEEERLFGDGAADDEDMDVNEEEGEEGEETDDEGVMGAVLENIRKKRLRTERTGGTASIQ